MRLFDSRVVRPHSPPPHNPPHSSSGSQAADGCCSLCDIRCPLNWKYSELNLTDVIMPNLYTASLAALDEYKGLLRLAGFLSYFLCRLDRVVGLGHAPSHSRNFSPLWLTIPTYITINPLTRVISLCTISFTSSLRYTISLKAGCDIFIVRFTA